MRHASARRRKISKMITLYAAPTGNCQRVSIFLEELGEPYEVVAIDFSRGDLQSPAFLAVNPLGQAPAITDSHGPEGVPMHLAESSAILAYLARRAGRFSPEGSSERIAADYWVAALAGLQGVQTALFVARWMDVDAHAKIIAKLIADSHRYLRVMDARLAVSPYLAGARYTYVDILGFSIAHRPNGFTLDDYPAIEAWRALIAARPAVQRGLAVPA